MTRLGIQITGLALSLAVFGCGRPGPPDRVFLVTIDTLRADHLGLYGYPRETSPFLDALGEASQVFETAYSSISHTAPSHASLFTALHPVQHRLLRNGEELHETVLTLAELYRSQGYRTAAFTTASFMKGLEAGFDEFVHRESYFPAATILGAAQAWIAGRSPDDKLFAWIHLFDVHEWIREEHLDSAAVREIRTRSGLRGQELLDYLQREHGTTFGRGRRKVLRAVNRYDGQILSVDRELRRFFEWVERDNAASNDLWIVTSDHGEGLGNHDYLGHGKTVYTEQIHVPLVFHFTDRRYAPSRIPGLVRLVDVAPTLAELAGTSFEAQTIPPAGRSLVPLLEDPGAVWDVKAVFAQRRPADEMRLKQGWTPGEVVALRSERHSLIASTEGTYEIYDLVNDRFELDDLAGDPPAETERWLDGLLRRYSAMSAQGEKLGDGTIRPEYVEELRALGYL